MLADEVDVVAGRMTPERSWFGLPLIWIARYVPLSCVADACGLESGRSGAR